jgi:hypothetical protein
MVGRKEGKIAACAIVDAGSFVVVHVIAERTFGIFMPEDPVSLGRQ